MTKGTSVQDRAAGGISGHAAAWLAYSVLAMAVLLSMLGSLLLLLNDRFPPPSMEILLPFVTFLVVGVLIASRRPDNPIGWMFCSIGLASAWEFFAQEYAFYALVAQPGALPGGAWMAWTQIWTAATEWLLMFFALLLFPNGRLPSPRWRPFAWFAATTLVLLSVLAAFEPGLLPGARVPNPAGIEHAAFVELSQGALRPISDAIAVGIVLAMAASVIVRFRRARGEERQQLKWLAYTAGFLGALLGLSVLNFQVLHNRVLEFALGVPGIVAVAAVPAAIGVAILRYRLYDIDFVINRTLVFGVLTVTLVTVYAGTVVALQGLLRALTGQESQLAIVASTLAVAALFQPLRRRVQGFIDRRFYRRKYDAREVLEGFSAKLRDETDLDALSGDLAGVVRETMRPAHLSLWLRPDTASRRQRAN